MADSLKHIIDRLKQTKVIISQSSYVEILTSIDKFAENDINKAYLLGHFFKYKLDPDNLPADDKKLLLDTIKNNNLDTYYYLKTKPDYDNFETFMYLFIIVGLILIIIGTIQLSNGDFWYGLGTKYLVPIMREGGYKVILGLVLFIGGFIRIKHEIKKKHFLQLFLAQTNNSN